ncbi:MAG TPA: Na+/H+ antiporter NhaA [Candidatus Saccharimonadales bacterium]|nr:Na+/H+ antiporter NhaA [Candidatus Saccharimonadales bacterium]
MLKHKIRKHTLAVTERISDLMSLLLRDEAISGKFLVIAAGVALIIANTAWHDGFNNFWQQHLYIGIGNFGISETLKHWIDEGLMAIFFLVIGLEVKREIVRGELSTWRAASLPIVAAVGGMIFAVAIYMFINAGQPGFHGWGIPMTTDTALALGVLALVSTRIPAALKVFLLAVMVVDDLTAIIAIAVFYNSDINVGPLLVGGVIVLLMLGLQWARLMRLSTFVILGVLLWIFVHASGVHASIAGAVMGLAAPIVPRWRKITKRAIAERLERSLIPVTTFVIIPLFALANTGVTFTSDAFSGGEAAKIGLGVVGGLLIGKSLGIVAGTWLVVKLGISGLPHGVRWGHITGVAMLAGIGFTLSIFIAELAFEGTPYTDTAKIAIFGASIVAATVGLFILRLVPRHRDMLSETADTAGQQFTVKQ